MLPHAINRRRVRSDEDGNTYAGRCYHCHAPLRRIKRDQWVRDWRATFGMTPRAEADRAPPPANPPSAAQPTASRRRRSRRKP